MPMMAGTKTSSALNGRPRRLALRLSQLNMKSASPKAITALAAITISEPQAENAGSRPMARPIKAFMPCEAGSNCANFKAGSGSMECGSIKPPSSMDGTKSSCDHKTVARDVGETTPINTATDAQISASTRKTRIKSGQLTGMGALNINPEARVIIADTMVTCSNVVSMGMIKMEKDGTPLIL